MSKNIIKGIGNPCPKCNLPMNRKVHFKKPKTIFFFSEWDYCEPCRHVQHYEKYKTSEWKIIEEDRQNQYNYQKLF